MSQDDVILRQLQEAGAIITNGHFVYASGRHGSDYVNKDGVYPDTELTSGLAFELALRFTGRQAIHVVIAPAVGAVILAHEVARHLSIRLKTKVFGVYADKDGDGFAIKRGYDQFVRGQPVLVVEDVLTTGGSAKKVVEAVRAIGGQVIGVGALCNRGGVTTHDLGDVPALESLVNIQLETWDENDCPLCRDGVPINTDVGKGREWLAKRKG